MQQKQELPKKIKPPSAREFLTYCYNCKEPRVISATQERRLRARNPEDRICVSCSQIKRSKNKHKVKPGPKKKKITEPAIKVSTAIIKQQEQSKKKRQSNKRAEKVLNNKQQSLIKMTDDLIKRNEQKQQQIKDTNMIEQYLQNNEPTVITQKYDDPSQTGSAMEINTRMGF